MPIADFFLPQAPPISYSLVTKKQCKEAMNTKGRFGPVLRAAS